MIALLAALLMSMPSVSAPRMVAGTSELLGSACATTHVCYAVGDEVATREGVVVPIIDGSVRTPIPVPGTTALSAVSCGSPVTCEAVGISAGQTAALVPIDRGVPAGPVVLDTPVWLLGVDCTSATACVAVGGYFTDGTSYVVSIADGTRATVRAVRGIASLDSVACETAVRCYAAGGSVTIGPLVLPITNGEPGAPEQVLGAGLLDAIACPSATTCYAAGQGIAPLFDELLLVDPLGPAWVDSLLFAGVTIDDGGVVSVVTDGSPGPALPVVGTTLLYGIACTSTVACDAVGWDRATGAGVIAPLFDGVSAHVVDVAATHQLDTIACGAPTACVAAGAIGFSFGGVTVPIR